VFFTDAVSFIVAVGVFDALVALIGVVAPAVDAINITTSGVAFTSLDAGASVGGPVQRVDDTLTVGVVSI